jgi:hypothetical protein
MTAAATTVQRRAQPGPQHTARDDRTALRRGTPLRLAAAAMVTAFVFQPILHPTGPANSSPVDLLMLVAIVSTAVWAVGTHRAMRAPYVLPVALMTIAGTASGLRSAFPVQALQSVLTDIVLFAWCVAVVNLLSVPRVMRYAMVAWAWSGIAWAAIVVLAWLGHVAALEGLQPAEGNRVLFTFGDPNYASAYWDATIFVVYATRVPRERWARWAGYALLLAALALTESNGGALALVAGVLLLLLVRVHRRHGWVGVSAVTLSVVLGVGAVLAVFPPSAARAWAQGSGQSLLVNSIGRSGQSSSERGLLVGEMRSLYEGGGGLLGVGPATTKSVLASELYPYSNEAHDDVLAALVERGPVGVLGVLLLVAIAVSWAVPLVRRLPTATYAAAVPVPAGVAAALVAVGMNSLYEEVLHFRFVWTLLALVAVLGYEARRR